MNNETKSLKKKLIQVLSIVGIVAAIILGVFIIYISQYYETESQVNEVLGSSAQVEVTTSDNMLIFTPKGILPSEGIILYPDKKVEYTAYAPIMNMIASQGFQCILMEMPYNLPSLDKNAAQDAIDKFQFVSDWYIAGHGMGGTTAAEFASAQSDLFQGVILLGAYSNVDLSDSGLKVLSIYGSEDKIMDIEKYNKKVDLLPADYKEVIIPGGNHDSFGYYGEHKGDGMPTITKYQQQAYSAVHVVGFITGEEVTITLEDLSQYGK